jgi:hypothetical protein
MYVFGGLDAGESAFNPLAAAGFTIAAPAIGLGYVLGSAITNHRARQAAVPQWRFDGQGTMTMADYGIYFPNPATGVAVPVPYSMCTSCLLTHPNRIEMDLQADGDAFKIAVVSPAAVVAFMLWCLTVYPAHPQLKGILGIQ